MIVAFSTFLGNMRSMEVEAIPTLQGIAHDIRHNFQILHIERYDGYIVRLIIDSMKD